jgi:hypothetical protein
VQGSACTAALAVRHQRRVIQSEEGAKKGRGRYATIKKGSSGDTPQRNGRALPRRVVVAFEPRKRANRHAQAMLTAVVGAAGALARAAIVAVEALALSGAVVAQARPGALRLGRRRARAARDPAPGAHWTRTGNF